MASEVSSGTTTNQVGEEETRLELPPGFRYYPTEEEIILHYLRARCSSFSCPVIADADLNKMDPWGLPGKEKMGEKEWYFFSNKDRKYPTGLTTNGITITSDVRFSTSDDVLYNDMPWATDMDIVKAFVDLYSPWSQYHLDLKPSNILLDEKTENQLSDFGLPNLLHGDGVPANNRPLDAKVSGKPSAKPDIEISSHMTHRRRHLRVHHHPLIQMLPTARKWSDDILTSCARLITSMRTFGIAEAGYWVSAKPETPRAGPVSEYIIRKLLGIRNGLTENESQQHSDPDSCRSGHLKRAVNAKTSASWIVATSAPHHATGNRSLLSGFIMDHDDQFVHAVNRVPMKVLARGAVVTDAFILPDVWFVPGLTENLVSVSQLAELDHSIGFGRGECCIRSAHDGKIVGKGRLQKGGHYVLDYLKVPLAI